MADQRLRLLGLACAASGVLGVLIGIVTLAYPAGDMLHDQMSYPFPVNVQWAVSVVLAVAHVLTLAGFIGVLVANPHRGSRTAVTGLWLAVAGFAALSVCEVLSAAIGGQLSSSSSAESLSAAFGVASLLTAVGSVMAGVVIVRAKMWQGLGRWMVLASAAVMILLATPAEISGELALSIPALMLWSLTFIPLGRAIAESKRSDPSAASAPMDAPLASGR